MSQFIRLSVFSIYSLLCFGVAGYAFYYLFLLINPSDYMAKKFAQAGFEITAHFFGAGLSLLLVPFQLSQKIRKYSKNIHKKIGFLYVIAVLFGSISGFIMSFNAEAGVWAEWGFRLMSIVWFIATIKAVTYAMNGNITAHKKWIYRSIALTSAAITFRIYLGVGMGPLNIPFVPLYITISWACWVLNLMLCEMIIYRIYRHPSRVHLAPS